MKLKKIRKSIDIIALYATGLILELIGGVFTAIMLAILEIHEPSYLTIGLLTFASLIFFSGFMIIISIVCIGAKKAYGDKE